MSDFADEPSSDSAQLFSVGYPDISIINDEPVDMHPAAAHWSSTWVSLPAVVWGHVSIIHPRLNYYWVDMSVYPGNSGGPVIERDKIVGIVSEQAVVPIQEDAPESDSAPERNPPSTYKIPFARITKARYVRPLIEAQILKDEGA